MQTKRMLVAVQLSRHTLRKSLFLIVFSLTFCNKKAIDKDSLLVQTLQTTECFSQKNAWKDSVENIKRFLEPYRVFRDSVNSVIFYLHLQSVDFCVVDRVILVEKGSSRYAIPYCELQYYDYKPLPLFYHDKNNKFINETKRLFQDLDLKDKEYFVKCLFEGILKREQMKTEDIKFLTFSNPIDSVEVFRYLSKSNSLNYKLFASNAFWSLNITGDSLNIELVNGKMIVCYEM